MKHRLWIGGQWEDSQGGETMKIENPATGEVIAEVVNANLADVDRAVQAAKTAFYDGRWSRQTPEERSLALWRLADLLQARTSEFARLESENTGKPYQHMSFGSDIPYTVSNLRFFAAATRDTHGLRAGEYAAGYTSMFRREPVGVVGLITPWNYPLMMAVWKIGPALAAGCTTVLKPAPSTPLTTLLLAELIREAGIPDGVVNIVTGGNDTGQALVEHPDIRMVSLTGSTITGKKIMKIAADTLKRVHLKLGGKAPFIIFDDADIEFASKRAVSSSTSNSGQACTAATRVYVEQSRYRAVKEALVEAARGIKVGEPFEPDVTMGPLISLAQRERVKGFIERAQMQGAKVLTGGNIPKQFECGYYFEPTIVVNADQKSEIIQSEVFGPVLTLNTFRTDEEALQFGNDVLYGLAASVFTSDIGRAMQMASQLEFGTVWINDHQIIPSETPHGGFKQSGMGKDLSIESIYDYTITKHVLASHRVHRPY